MPLLTIFLLSAKVNRTKWSLFSVGQTLNMSAKVRGLSGNVVGQSKWLSDKFNKDFFGQDQSLMAAKCKFSHFNAGLLEFY